MNPKALGTLLVIGAIICLASQPPAQAAIPNDPMFGQQWNLQRIGATNAWATTTGSAEVVVAILSSGVNYNHEDLRGNMWRNPGETGLDAAGRDKATNGIDDDGNGYADDVYGVDTGNHDSDPIAPATERSGTACASVIGAVSNNGKGVAGLNWRVSLMAVKSANDNVGATEYSSLAEGLEYVLLMKNRGVNIRVVLMTYWYGSTASERLRAAHEALGQAGILTVTGAGHSGSNLDAWPQYPFSWRLPSMLVVAASGQSDGLLSVPNYNANYGANTVDLAAPGQNIIYAGATSNAYETGDGPGLSAAQVAGAAALLLAVRPNLTVDELKAAILGSVDQPPALRGKVATNGRLNVGRALTLLTETNPAPLVATASPRGQRTPTNAPIEVVFNRPMNRVSVESAFVITPPVSGTFVWATDNRSLSFLHDTPFDPATNYTVRILGTAQDESGQTLDGNYNRIREGSPTDDFVWTFYLPVPNDDFTGAHVLTGLSGFVQANNQRGSVEDEELEAFTQLPADWESYGSTLWYQWTAPEPGGWFTFDLTSGTAFDSLLAAFTGNQPARLVTVAGNDNYGTRTASRISFQALPNTNYYVWVATKYDGDPLQVGNFKMAWYPTPPPSFTGSQFSPSSGASGTIVTLFGTNFAGATSVLFKGASASFTNALNNNNDLRITAVVPPDAISGPITVVTPHGSATTSASFQVPRPKLALSLSGPNPLIRWPGTSTAWVLEETEDLVYGQWTPVTQTPILTNGETRMLLEMSAGNSFYRLKRK